MFPEHSVKKAFEFKMNGAAGTISGSKRAAVDS